MKVTEAPDDAKKGAADTLWESLEDRRRVRDGKREAVLRMAIKLFLAQGYHRTTLTEIAERLNITKPALYRYFASKEEILLESYRRGHEMIDAALRVIACSGGTGLEKLHELIRSYAAAMMTGFGRSLVSLDDRELSPEAFAKMRADKKTIDSAFRAIIASGITDGSIDACDPKLTAFAIAGALNWIGIWYHPDGGVSADAIAEEFALRLSRSVAKTV